MALNLNLFPARLVKINLLDDNSMSDLLMFKFQVLKESREKKARREREV